MALGSLRRRLRGVVPPLCTMLTPRGELWPEAQRQLLDLVAPHADALFVSGTTGLCPWLSLDAQKALLELTLAYVDEKGLDLPVICAAAGNTAGETAARVRALAASGAAAVVVYTPFFFRHAEEELVEFFHAVAQLAGDVGLVLYNLPQMTGNDITPSVAEQVSSLSDRYVAVKDSKGDVAQFEALLALKGRMNVLLGDEQISRHVLGRADGCVPAAANVFPLLWRRIMDEAGDQEALDRYHAHIVAVKRDVYGRPDMPQVISGILTALEMLGVGGGPTPPFLPVDRLAAGRRLRESIAQTLRRLRDFIPEPFRSRAPR